MVYLSCSCSQMCAYIETDQSFCRGVTAWTQLVITCSDWDCELILTASQYREDILSLPEDSGFLQSPRQ